MKNILIYRTGSLGDTIVSLPAIQLIKNINPNCKIFYLCVKNHDSDAVSPLKILKKINLVDNFLEIEKIDNFKSLFNSIEILKQNKINKFYYLNEDRPIFNKLRDYLYFKFLLNCNFHGLNIFKKNNKYYEGFYLANKVKKISFKELNKLNKILSIKIKKNIKRSKIFKYNNYITISPGGRIPEKRWNVNNWKILINKIISKNKNIKIVLLGTKKDKFQNIKISNQFKKNILNLTGKTSFASLMFIINSSKIHISHDDGTMHLAILLQKKVLSLFHNIDFKEKWFQGHNSNHIQLYGQNGVNSIKVQNVFSSFLKLKNIEIN